MPAFSSLLFVLLSATPLYGAFYDSLAALPEKDFDFIVVGGGTAGSVVASRLSENKDVSVLLIEAGPNNEGIQDLMIPAYRDRLPSTYNWGYNTVAQPGANNRSFGYPRGHVLGGSSSTNAMIYSRGAVDDFDRWAKVTGDEGWSWNSLFRLVSKHEKWVPPPGGRNVTGQYNPAVHGTNGNLAVSLPWRNATAFDELCFKNAEAQKDEFPNNLDQSSGHPIGLTWQQYSINNGERSSAATAYLNSTVRARTNLAIVVNTYTTRVLPVAATGLDIRKVEVAPRKGGERRVITAKKEILLAGGAFGSAQILLNSGIGPEADLKAVNVTLVHNSPNVGKDMQDHFSAGFTLTTKVPAPQNPSTQEALRMWQQNRTGPLTETTGHLQLWTRIPSDSAIWETYEDPSPGPSAPHIETTVYSTFGTSIIGGIVLLSPHSRGSMKIRSNDPFDPPLIDPGMLTHPFDALALQEGFKNTARFFSGEAWGGQVGALSPSGNVSAKDWESSIKRTIGTFGHPVGSTAMSAKGSTKGVVDPDLRVKGVTGIRVIDAAAMPFVVSAHMQASVYLFAERAAEIIQTQLSV
ncbi:pyranose dehydrogenase [Coprinopsis sp. MPI-PUGE-AT-0042]|nr:pyranose dehydrogenase [Coprinopsis sp. MPI-PUGE-AT-0042]